MKLVQRANKQLRVPDDRLADMLAAGYVEINPKTGKPVKLEKPAAKNAPKDPEPPKDPEQ